MGLSQEKLARELDYTSAAIAKMEQQGDKEIARSKVIDLALKHLESEREASD